MSGTVVTVLKSDDPAIDVLMLDASGVIFLITSCASTFLPVTSVTNRPNRAVWLVSFFSLSFAASIAIVIDLSTSSIFGTSVKPPVARKLNFASGMTTLPLVLVTALTVKAPSLLANVIFVEFAA